MVQPVDDETFVRIIWISISLGTFLLLILFVLSIKNLFCRRQAASTRSRQLSKEICNIPIDKISHILFSLFHVGYITCNISWMIWWYILLEASDTLKPEQRAHFLQIFNTLSVILWALSTESFLSMLILRVHSVFHGTEYEVARWKFGVWALLLFLILVTYTLFVADILDVFDTMGDNTFNNLVFPTIIILNSITGISLLYTFGTSYSVLSFSLKLFHSPSSDS